MTLDPVHFYMIRHGETDYNESGRMSGQLDAQLTARGRAQALEARRIVENLSHPPIFIVHSALSRTWDTAKLINEGLGLPCAEVADLNERHFGQWQGLPLGDIRDRRTQGLEPPDGETIEQFVDRSLRGMGEALRRPQAPVLIVSHGGIFSAFFRHFGLQAENNTENCRLYEFVPAEKQTGFLWDVFCYKSDRREAVSLQPRTRP